MSTYLTTTQLAERYSTSAGTLRYWRSCDRGPRSFRVGRSVLYDLDDVEAWEREQRRRTGRGGVEAKSPGVTGPRTA